MLFELYNYYLTMTIASPVQASDTSALVTEFGGFSSTLLTI